MRAYKTSKSQFTYYINQGKKFFRIYNRKGLKRSLRYLPVNSTVAVEYTYDYQADGIAEVEKLPKNCMEIDMKDLPYNTKRSFQYYTTVADNRRYKYIKQQKQLMFA